MSSVWRGSRSWPKRAIDDVLRDARPAWEDPKSALSAYLTAEMQGYSMLSGGGSPAWRRPERFGFQTGRGREGQERLVRAVSGLKAVLSGQRVPIGPLAATTDCQLPNVTIISPIGQIDFAHASRL